MRLRIGGRGSRLSRRQMSLVADLLSSIHKDIEFDFVSIRTGGDVDRDTPLYRVRGKGIFEKEVNKALIEGDIDLAVHSAKDVPFDSIDGPWVTPIVPVRGSRFDVLVSKYGWSLDDVPSGAVVGSSSIRRISFLKCLREDLKVRNIRGNVDSRIKKLIDGFYDAIILGEAGLSRLDINIPYYRLPLDKFVPAAGQGAILVLVKKDSEAESIVRSINDVGSFLEVMVEKIFMKLVGGGCNIPIGVTSFYEPHSNMLSIISSVVRRERGEQKIFRKAYRLSKESIEKIDAIYGIAYDFYKFFMDGGGGEILSDWLEV